jgi:hypothetical protein
MITPERAVEILIGIFFLYGVILIVVGTFRAPKKLTLGDDDDLSDPACIERYGIQEIGLGIVYVLLSVGMVIYNE